MFIRLSARTLFWGTLAVAAGALGLLTVGATAPFSPWLVQSVAEITRLLGVRVTPAGVAPWLSLGAVAIAVASWRQLHSARSGGRGTVASLPYGLGQLHQAMQANLDGMLLLRTIRDGSGAVRDFEILDVNPSAAALLRSPSSALVGKRLRRDLPALSSDAMIARYASAADTGQAVVDEIRVNRRHVAAGWLLQQVVPTVDGIAITVRDITAQKRETLRLARVSMTDDLTGLANRRGFLMLADQQLRIARRQERDSVLLYVDMDAFKALNDAHGHAEGDRALVAVAKLLRTAMRDSDVVGRMGGDEFTIMALDADRFAARSIQRRIEEHVALLNASGELARPISLTIGHTRVRPTDQAPVVELLARADALMYERKRRRKLTTRSKTTIAGGTPDPRPARVASARPPARVPQLAIPPDVAAMARAATVAAASRVLTAPNGTPYTPTRMS